MPSRFTPSRSADIQIDVPPDEAARFAETLREANYDLDERAYKVAISRIVQAILSRDRPGDARFPQLLSAFFVGQVDLGDLGFSDSDGKGLVADLASVGGIRGALTNLCGGQWGPNNFRWIPGAIDDGLADRIVFAFSTLTDPTISLTDRVDRFRSDLKEIEQDAAALPSWNSLWKVSPIQLAFVGAVLGAFDPTMYTFYPSGQLQSAFDAYGEPWPKEAGGIRYAAACDFVRAVFQSLSEQHVPVQDLIDAQSFIYLRADSTRRHLRELTDADAVVAAMNEFDDIGRDAFLLKYGFDRSLKYIVRHDGRDYDSKPIVGAAFGVQHPAVGPLRSDEFSGGENGAGAVLRRLGFEVVASPATQEASIKFWWVNQGSTFVAETSGGFLWAPVQNKVGQSLKHWSSLLSTKPGDIVLHYANGSLRGSGTITAAPVESRRPDSLPTESWEARGVLTGIAFKPFSEPISLAAIPADLRIAEGAPFNSLGGVQQGYLYPLSETFIAELQILIPELRRRLNISGDDFDGQRTPRLALSIDLLRERVRARGLVLADHVLLSALAALESGKHLMLTGPPGTAKTTLAEVIATAAVDAGRADDYVLSTATADWTTFETIGGLRPTSTSQLEFKAGHFVEAIEANSWLIIDELNRSNFDRAFGQLFTVLSGQAVVLPYTRGEEGRPIALVPEGAKRPAGADVITVPRSWRIIATMNVFDKSLLFEMSFALMRRFAFVEVSAPSDEAFKSLLADAAAPSDTAADLACALLPLRKRKDLGPAIYLDVTRFIASRLALDSSGSHGRVLYEAFYSFLLPQFEGIDEVDGEALYREVAKLVGRDCRDQLRRNMNSVLGLHIGREVTPNPTSEDTWDSPSDDEVDGGLQSRVDHSSIAPHE